MKKKQCAIIGKTLLFTRTMTGKWVAKSNGKYTKKNEEKSRRINVQSKKRIFFTKKVVGYSCKWLGCDFDGLVAKKGGWN